MAVNGNLCGHILIVEDDPPVRELIGLVLGDAGYQTEGAATGKQALDAVRSAKPDLMVLDVYLPDISGYAVCRTLRRERRDWLPILFLSGERTEAPDRVAGLLIGADDYMVKPFAPDELVARVQCLLRRAHNGNGSNPRKLTAREREVLGLLAEGLAHADIARRLVISPKTVGTHIEHILDKLGVRSRAQAVALAYRESLLEAPL